MSARITDRPLKRLPNGAGHFSQCEHSGRYKRPRTSLTKGVTRQSKFDGYGNLNVFWVATIRAEGRMRSAQFSVRKNGEDGAKRLATLRRLEWMIELGIWRPEDGDPFAQLGSDITMSMQEAAQISHVYDSGEDAA